ncbi:MAG: hypothetical protein GY754_06945 [bacterium]|nr:hypothetical protein [bacterium]
MKPRTINLLTFVLLVFFVIITSYSVHSRKRYSYVGAKACSKCHSEESIGNQRAIWAASPHFKAVKTLKKEKAKAIGEKVGVANPAESRKCLKCHTTGRGKVASLNEEGVGCEACHGAGAGYYETANHVNFLSRKNGYKRAKKFGMYPVLEYEDNLKNREKLCLHCHNKKRLCFPETSKEIMKQKITIQVIDKMEKGDLRFSHKLRRF